MVDDDKVVFPDPWESSQGPQGEALEHDHFFAGRWQFVKSLERIQEFFLNKISGSSCYVLSTLFQSKIQQAHLL